MSPSTETTPQSFTFAVASDATHEVNDKSNYENCAEYAADVHVGLLKFSSHFIGPCDKPSVCALPYRYAMPRSVHLAPSFFLTDFAFAAVCP